MAGQFPVAFFITPHGFGHAARAVAIANALHRKLPGLLCHIFTEVPEFFFRDSLKAPFTLHRCLTDIGMMQKNPVEEDPQATLENLPRVYPFEEQLLQELSDTVLRYDCRFILADIAPLGLTVARRSGLPSVLVENFTWDWIYDKYLHTYPQFADYISLLKKLFQQADYRIQTEPLCVLDKQAVQVHPVARSVRSSSEATRKQLGISTNQKVVLVSFGGHHIETGPLASEAMAMQRITFLFSGVSDQIRREKNLVFLPATSTLGHPDLVAAADAVIGKIGYSTLAEVYIAGVPFGYVKRAGFRESHVLEKFIAANMPGIAIPFHSFENGGWLQYIPRLLAQQRHHGQTVAGAQQAADFLYSKVCGE